MPRRLIGTFLICCALAAGIAASALVPAQPVLHRARASDSDLEITGLVRGLPPGSSAYLRRSDLLALPQIRATISDDLNLHGTLHVSGVSFETIAKVVGALPEADLIDALCTDHYRAHFPFDYITKHQPILILTIDGKPLSAFGVDSHQYDAGPYMVSYQHFVPSFRVLAHDDEPQIPDNLVRLNFTTQADTFTPIAPRGSFGPGSPEQQGFTIARQNCLRCHFQGAVGGTKSGRSWHSLGVWAREQPLFFQQYVKNPQRFEPHSHMAPNPSYDEPTLRALTAYFKTFAEAH